MNMAQFFYYVQNAPWYFHFLKPVLQILEPLPDNAKVLDVGTGAGKLLELGKSQTSFHWEGADTDNEMLSEARRRPTLQDVPLHLLSPDSLPFENASFDAATFCSVLFLIPDPLPLLEETVRILRPNGRLVALTPTGEGNISPELIRQIGIHPQNWTFFLWRQMTSASGHDWARKGILAEFARQKNATYNKQIVFNGLAAVEWIQF
ncbi:MAG: class I SAM-dependent methyltransferase [Anaerolineales bacterium]|nr:class I SAM-dependent methyltransferase [Anaerolineales bacterium]